MKKKKSRAEIARNMGAIRSTGGRTERLVRSALHRRGLRFRKNDRSVIGKPDIVFRRERVAVFIDGDYWHGRMVREGGIEHLESYFDDSQKGYWSNKLLRNMERDETVTESLEASGWTVYRVWESEARAKLEDTVARIEELVRSRREPDHTKAS